MIYSDTADFLKLSFNFPVVDVRSPGEFEHGHITQAVNIPLFDNNERAEIGTIFTKKGQVKAIERGYEIASPKRLKFIEEARKIAIDSEVLVHCWRGGMRSEHMAKLFEEAGLNCKVLQGGYKAYRNKLFQDLGILSNLIVIHGPTGCGKTEILKALGILGEQVIDLEGIANHRGSAFGNLGLPPQPTTMQFQNDIHAFLLKHDLARPIWVEGESLNIGKVYLPDTLWECMNHATIVKIEMDKPLRIKRILNEYGNFSAAILIESLRKLHKRYGGDRTSFVEELIKKGQLEDAVDLLLEYYDKNYLFSFGKYVKGEILTIKAITSDASQNATLILNQVKQSTIHA